MRRQMAEHCRWGEEGVDRVVAEERGEQAADRRQLADLVRERRRHALVGQAAGQRGR